jgi:hypothetical protein
MRKAHALAIAEGKKKSWRKGGASRIAYEKRQRAASRTSKHKAMRRGRRA